MFKKERQLCQLVFHLFAQGFTSKEIEQQCPETKDIIYFKLLLKPSFDLVFQQIQKKVGNSLPKIKSQEFTQAKRTLLEVMVSRTKYVYKGVKCNFFGQSVTQTFILICKEFLKKGNLNKVDAKILQQNVKGIYDQFIKQYPPLEVEQIYQVQMGKKKSNYKPTAILDLDNQQCLNNKLPFHSQPSGKDLAKNQGFSQLKVPNQNINQKIKQKQLEIFKLQHQIFLQKQRMLQMEREKQLLQQKSKLRQKEKKVFIEKQPPSRQRIPLWVKQEKGLLPQPVVRRKKKKTDRKPQKIDLTPVIQFPSDLSSQQSLNQVEEDSEYRESEQNQSPQQQTKKKQSKKKKSNSNQRYKANQQIEQQHMQINDIYQQQSQTKKAKKTSKKPSKLPSIQSNTIKASQMIAPFAAVFNSEDKKQQIVSKVSALSQGMESQPSQPPKNHKATNKIATDLQNENKISTKKSYNYNYNHEWSVEQQQYLIQLLADPKIKTHDKVSKKLLLRFRNERRFKPHYVLQKRFQMFRNCAKRFIYNLIIRNIYSQPQLDRISTHLLSIDWRKSFVFAQDFLKNFYFAQYSNVNEQIFITTVGQILEQKQKIQAQTPQNIYNVQSRSNIYEEFDHKQQENRIPAGQKLQREVIPFQQIQSPSVPQRQESSQFMGFKHHKQLEKGQASAQNKKNMAFRTVRTSRQIPKPIQPRKDQSYTNKDNQLIQEPHISDSSKQAKYLSLKSNQPEGSKNAELQMSQTTAQRQIAHKSQNQRPKYPLAQQE